MMGILRRTNNCLIQAIGDAAHIHVTQEDIDRIRERIQKDYGVPIGSFLEADDENIRIIMEELGLSGIVYIHNAQNPHHAVAPVHVGSSAHEYHIYYSRNHFAANIPQRR